MASIQPRTSLVKFARSPRTDPPGRESVEPALGDAEGPSRPVQRSAYDRDGWHLVIFSKLKRYISKLRVCFRGAFLVVADLILRRTKKRGDVHISTGMTTKEEIEKIVTFWEQGKGNAKERVVLYNCTSGSAE